MNETNICPCCGRHCDLSEPHCDRGREYLRTGVIPERKPGHEHHGEHGEHGGHGKHGGHGEHGGHGRHGDHEGHDEHECHRHLRRPDNYAVSDIQNKLVINLRDLGHTLRSLFEGRGSQKHILIVLRESGPITQRELTEKLGIKPGSASEVIGKLEAAGLICRVPSDTDRRTMDIRLTEEGRVQAEEAAAKRQGRHQEMFSCLSAEERETLLALLEKLSADWNTRYGREEKRPDGCGHEHHGPHGRGL